LSISEIHAKPKTEWVPTNLRIHPDLRALLKYRAALDRLSMEEFLHSLLCREFDRPDLIPGFRESA
jgi:uncharacterized protein (DUF1778 family)